MKTLLKSIWSSFIRYFGQGLLFIVPITASIFVLYILFEKVDTLMNLKIPGLGLVIITISVTLVGYIGSRFVTSPLFKWLNGLITKTPILKIIYSSVSDLLSAFVGNKKKFTKPVLVKLSKDSDAHQIGFLTQTDLNDLGIDEGMVSVYIPFSYSIMGNVFIVPKENISQITASPTETMKFIVSGGITNIEEQRKQEKLNTK